MSNVDMRVQHSSATSYECLKPEWASGAPLWTVRLIRCLSRHVLLTALGDVLCRVVEILLVVLLTLLIIDLQFASSSTPTATLDGISRWSRPTSVLKGCLM